MVYGILKNKSCKDVFEQINKRTLCEECHKERSLFSQKDKKGKPSYSNLLPGFSSSKITIPVDVLIVAEAHGGGRPEDFRPQKELDYEISWLADYYMRYPLIKFHQQEIRRLLKDLDIANKTWVFTDLIKCFVWQGFDKKNNLVGRNNKESAIKHCSKYLDKQAELLQPRKIIALGKTVANEYFRLRGLRHGITQEIYIGTQACVLIYSIFPSRNTVDLWIANNGWAPIYSAIELKSSVDV